jgi:hypothetical protein
MKELATAMAKAQGQIKTALKDSKNPHFKSSYADLTSVWDACREALSKNGFSVIQRTDFEAGGEVWLETMLLHSSGEHVSSRYPLRPAKADPQGYGSAITYARRYCLAAIVGVVADEDDDGNAASQRNGNHVPPQEDTGLAAAKAFVRRSVKEIGALASEKALAEWRSKMDGHLARLLDKYPDEGAAVMSALVLQAQAFKAAAE